MTCIVCWSECVCVKLVNSHTSQEIWNKCGMYMRIVTGNIESSFCCGKMMQRPSICSLEGDEMFN